MYSRNIFPADEDIVPTVDTHRVNIRGQEICLPTQFLVTLRKHLRNLHMKPQIKLERPLLQCSNVENIFHSETGPGEVVQAAPASFRGFSFRCGAVRHRLLLPAMGEIQSRLLYKPENCFLSPSSILLRASSNHVCLAHKAGTWISAQGKVHQSAVHQVTFLGEPSVARYVGLAHKLGVRSSPAGSPKMSRWFKSCPKTQDILACLSVSKMSWGTCVIPVACPATREYVEMTGAC